MAFVTGAPITQMEVARLSTDFQEKAVVLAAVKASTVLEDLPFKTTGTQKYRYHVASENYPEPQWANYDVKMPLVKGAFDTLDAEMFVIGAQIQIDQKHEQDKTIESPKGLQVRMLSEAIGYKFADAFFNGWTQDEGNDQNGNPAKSFPGIKYRLDNPDQFNLSTDMKLDASVAVTGVHTTAAVDISPAGLTGASGKANAQKFIMAMDQLLARVNTGTRDGVTLYASRDIWVRLPTVMLVGGAFMTTKDAFGRTVFNYGGVQIKDAGVIHPTKFFNASANMAIHREDENGIRNDAGAYSSLYAVCYGTDNLYGVQQFGIQKKDLGIDPTNGIFSNYVVQWPVGLVNKTPYDIARLYSIKVA